MTAAYRKLLAFGFNYLNYGFMRLISLDIQNFRTINACQLLFTDSLTGIIGRNGTGKSSIIEAIAWALYGNQAARSGKDEVKSTYAPDDATCEVSLTFMVHDEQYRVVRRLVGKNDRAEVQLFRGDSSESVGVSETKTYVGQILGLDWRGFLSSFLARQSELNALSDLQPAKRRDHLAGMLGIERLDKAINSIKNDSKVEKEKTVFLEKHLLEKEHVTKELSALKEKITEFASEKAKSAESAGKAKTDFQDIEKRYTEMSSLRDRYHDLLAALKAESQTGSLISEQLIERQKELDGITQLEPEIEKLKSEIEPVEALKKELGEIQQAAASQAARQSIEKQLADRQKEYEKQLAEIGKLSAKQSELTKRLKSFPGDIEKQEAETTKMLDDARQAYAAVHAEELACAQAVRKLSDQLTQINELGTDSVCDRCLRPLGEDFHSISDHLLKERKQLGKQQQAIKAKLDKTVSDGTRLKEQLSSLQKQAKEAEIISRDLQDTHEKLQALEETKQTIEQSIESLTEQLGGFSDKKVDSVKLKQLELSVRELESKAVRLSNLQGKVDRKNELADIINRLKEKQERVAKQITTIQQQLAEVSFDEEAFQKLTADLKAAQEVFETRNNRLQSLTHQYDLMVQDIKSKEAAIQKFEDTEKELEELRTALYHTEKLGILFTEYRKKLITSIRPILSQSTSELLSEMTDQKYSFVELDEQYNLRVMDQGIYYNVERFSGGEKDLANLCLRLAISLALTDAAGLDRSFIILDEVFGSQDPVRKELIIQALTRLKQRFPQIILVTHIEDIKDGVEEIIEVIQTDSGYSEVKCNGTAT